MVTTNNDTRIEKLYELAYELGAMGSHVKEFLLKFLPEDKGASFEYRYKDALKDANTIDEIYNCGYTVLEIAREELEVCENPRSLEWCKGINKWFNAYIGAVNEHCLKENIKYFKHIRTEEELESCSKNETKRYIICACVNEHKDVFRSIMLLVFRYAGVVEMLNEEKGLDAYNLFKNIRERYMNNDIITLDDVLACIFLKETYEYYVEQK